MFAHICRADTGASRLSPSLLLQKSPRLLLLASHLFFFPVTPAPPCGPVNVCDEWALETTATPARPAHDSTGFLPRVADEKEGERVLYL